MRLPLYRLLIIALFVSLVISIIILLMPDNDVTTPAASRSISPVTKTNTINKQGAENRHDTIIHKQAEPNGTQSIPEGVNTLFRDKPKTQVYWMERGKAIVIKNTPEADAANFRDTFFHRGAHARPVTCGEVQFLSDDSVIEDYQGFIYTGIQRTYLENDMVNFDIFWSIMCKQTLDEYFEDEAQ